MMGWFLLFSNFIGGGVRSIVCLFLIFRLLSTQKPGKKSIAAVLGGAAVISIVFSVT